MLFAFRPKFDFCLFSFLFVQVLANQVLAVHAIPVIVQGDLDDEDSQEPNHVVIPNPNNVIISSRPSSQLSQNGSSGYGSTRSQVGPFGTSNRPSPSASSSSSSSDSNQTNKPKKKRSVWFGGSLRGRSSNSEHSNAASEQIVEATEIKTRGQPQYASLRIPNRIQASFEDRGLDLVEAEVDSDCEAEAGRGQNEPPLGYYPLRHAGSLEAQVLFHFVSFYQQTFLVVESCRLDENK